MMRTGTKTSINRFEGMKYYKMEKKRSSFHVTGSQREKAKSCPLSNLANLVPLVHFHGTI